MWDHLSADTVDIDAVFAPLASKGAEFDRPWSVAELHLTEGDIDWLGQWFAALPNNTTLAEGDLLRRQLPRDKLAALMLVLGAERCRMFASEDYVWPALRKLVAREHPIMSELFLSNGQPSYLTKLAIEEAVRALRLRNAMDIEGAQQWFMTVKLQFGFTYKGAKRRLAEWLVGLGSPHAVQYLSGQFGPPELTSRSFSSLWTTLRQYRGKAITEEEAREVLQESPWIKRDWIDDLLVEARSRISTLGWGDEYPDAAARITAAGSSEDRGPLENIALHWPSSGQPRIAFRLDRDAIAEGCRSAQRSELDFHVDGQWVRRWTLQPGGTWDGLESIYAEPGHAPQRVNLYPKTLAARTGEGDLIQEWELADFGLLGDVFVFDLDEGRLVEFGVERLDPAGHYAIVCDRAYSLDGCSAIETFEPPDGPRKAIRLPSPLTGNLRLSYEGFTIWQPVAPQERDRPRVTATLRTHDDRVVSVGERIRLVVEGLPAEAADVQLLVGKRIESADRYDAAWVTVREVTITPELASKQKVVRVRYRLDEHVATIVPKLGLRLKGIALMTLDTRHPEAEPKLTPLNPGDLLSRTADGAQLRVWVPEEPISTRTFEGHCYVGPLRHGRVKLKDFPGLGGKLTIRGSDVHAFENACVDMGCVRDVYLVGLGRPAQVSLRVKRIPEPDNHRFAAWVPVGDGRTELVMLPRDALQASHESRDWQVAAPDNMLALALTWQGAWLGAWWRLDKLAQCGFQPTTSFFAAVRWLRLPLLLQEIVSWFEPLVVAKPFAFLEAWLQGKGLPEDIRKLDREPAHDTVIRQFVGHWRPQQDAHFFQAVRMVCGGVEPTTREGLLRAVEDISRYSLPLLWWVANRLARDGSSALREAISSFLGLAADQYDRQVTQRLLGKRRSASEYCAFGEDRMEGLTTAVLGWLECPAATLPTRERDDLLLMLGSESGRQFLAAKVLLHRAQDRGRAR